MHTEIERQEQLKCSYYLFCSPFWTQSIITLKEERSKLFTFTYYATDDIEKHFI